MGCWSRSRFATVVLIFQVLFLILFGVFAQYKYEMDVQTRWYYPMFQNVHVMMFIGFGFLMTFLKRYGYSAVGINFLIAAMVIQWHILFKGLLFLNHNHGKIPIALSTLILADFTSAAVLISFGAVLGKTSPLQLMIMGFLEVMVFAVNEWIATEIYAAADIGGSMIIHIFGAYFGLAVSRVIYRPEHSESANEGATYTSDLFSMIGTIFLWLYWPSFNGGIATSAEQQARAVINTYLSLAACTIVTFAVSSLVDKKGRFNMVHIQNATLAGGVAVGTAANFFIHPWGAVLIGTLAAVISTLGFKYVQPFLLQTIGLHDTCGVNNLHGMPGLFAAIVGAVAASLADSSIYKQELTGVFPLVDPVSNSTAVLRTAAQQGGYQAATMATTLGLALVGGLITGLFLRFVPGLDAPDSRYLFSDDKHFEVPDDFLSTYKSTRDGSLPNVDIEGHGSQEMHTNGKNGATDTKI